MPKNKKRNGLPLRRQLSVASSGNATQGFLNFFAMLKETGCRDQAGHSTGCQSIAGLRTMTSMLADELWSPLPAVKKSARLCRKSHASLLGGQAAQPPSAAREALSGHDLAEATTKRRRGHLHPSPGNSGPVRGPRCLRSRSTGIFTLSGGLEAHETRHWISLTHCVPLVCGPVSYFLQIKLWCSVLKDDGRGGSVCDPRPYGLYRRRRKTRQERPLL
jgi:hypothetical protein